mmetsp:Transcript_80986/g.161496  ORF Transcript_80986/g.161496 Transcript_80986/m.161496 type:complete len:200 (-) Transcript_80986:320-919(-)
MPPSDIPAPPPLLNGSFYRDIAFAWRIPSRTGALSDGRNTVLVPAWLPISLSMSKYCVRRSKSITSFGLDPSTPSAPLKSRMLSRSPSTIALRCFATPSPDSFFASQSASAALTRRIFSPSAFSLFASRMRVASLIWFMAAFTFASGLRSVTRHCRIWYPKLDMVSLSAFFTSRAISSLASNAESSSIVGRTDRTVSKT